MGGTSKNNIIGVHSQVLEEEYYVVEENAPSVFKEEYALQKDDEFESPIEVGK